MFKILRCTLTFVLLLTATLALSPAALAAPGLVSAPGTAAMYKTDIAGGTVFITNNYGVADVIEISLTTAPAANVVYWAYLPGVTDKTAQLGTITVKKGATTGKLTVSAGKLSDFNASGYINITTGGGAMMPCEYGAVGATTTLTAGTVTLRNSANSAELLVVKKEAVTKGMTAIAIVNGKIYKATAKADGVELQVPLAKGMEIGTPVWYTVAAAGCMDIGYSKLELGEVVTTNNVDDSNIRLFFQGDGVKGSSVMILRLSPGDEVYCYNAANSLLAKGKVPNNSSMVNLTGLTLSSGSDIYISIAENGKYESGKTEITVPSMLASPVLKATTVSVVNTKTDGAKITVKGLTPGDTVNIYDVQGGLLASDEAVELMSSSSDEEDLEENLDGANDAATPAKVDLVFEGLALGDTAATIYISVTVNGRSESTWLKVSVPAPK